MNNSQRWINVGYDLFAREGPDGIQVERLARILGLNKSGFYHYFRNRGIYFDHLIQHHRERMALMVRDIERIHSFAPEYLQVMINHQVPVMVTRQLVRHRHIGIFEKALGHVNEIVDRATMPAWSRYVDMSDVPELALRYFQLIRDVFYARITFDNFNPEFLRGIAFEAKALVKETVARRKLPLYSQQLKSEFFSFISSVS